MLLPRTHPSGQGWGPQGRAGRPRDPVGNVHLSVSLQFPAQHWGGCIGEKTYFIDKLHSCNNVLSICLVPGTFPIVGVYFMGGNSHSPSSHKLTPDQAVSGQNAEKRSPAFSPRTFCTGHTSCGCVWHTHDLKPLHPDARRIQR